MGFAPRVSLERLAALLGGSRDAEPLCEPGAAADPARPPTISAAYLSMQQEMHRNPHYGVASKALAPAVRSVIKRYGIRSLADYGAGKCNLRKALRERGVWRLDYFPYDPAFPEYGPPRPAQLVCCIDVLEHIEEDFLPQVLLELQSITQQYGFFSVHCGPARKTLPDGRNAHIIQKPSSWWLPRLCEYFEVAELQPSPGGFWVLVTPLLAG